MNNLSTIVKSLRKQYNITQEDLSLKSGVGLRFVRDEGYEFYYLPEYLVTEKAKNLGIESIIVERLINKNVKLLPRFENMISNSFLNEELKENYSELMRERKNRKTYLKIGITLLAY